jgi:hypothetical protein
MILVTGTGLVGAFIAAYHSIRSQGTASYRS